MKFQYGILILILGLFWACGSGSDSSQTDTITSEDSLVKGAVTYVDLSDPLEQALVKEGKAIYNAQCISCHYLDTALLNGPGWAGITNRRDADWIMNMILNVNVMLEVDSVAHQLLQDSDMKMPDQGLSVDKARAVLEFMRENDLEQTGKKDEGVKG